MMVSFPRITVLLFLLVGSTIAVIDCRYRTDTRDVVNYYTCTEIATKYQISLTQLYLFNPDLKSDCSNIQPNTKYCVAGVQEIILSKDGSCGPSHGNSSCRGYSGGQCCNSETWRCGGELSDCQAGTCYEGGCVGFPTEFSLDGSCGSQNGHLKCGGKWGDCCNNSGKCGSGEAFWGKTACQSGNCTILHETATFGASVPWQTGTTPDGTCGSVNGHTCDVAFGNCCSKDGVCGGLETHCGTGCQESFGLCKRQTIPPGTVSPDGSCGSASGYSCGGSSFGSCCSSSGFCGSTSGHCNAGCQATFGSCTTTDLSPDGTCGGTNKFKCVGSGFGDCCSSSGYCGSTTGHCSAGCQTTFGTCTNPSVSPDGTCGGTKKYQCVGSGYGECCSSSGYCGRTDGHCTAGCQTTFGTCTAPDLSLDGTCGGVNKFKCVGSGFGDCCSPSGYCGSTSAHCTAGCQTTFGKCTTTDTSPDGTCGGTKGYKCLNSEFGNCCSSAGYCGSSAAHCDAGCQSTFGTCSSSKVSPDGTCGGTNKYVCQGSAFGNCCSSSGYCGTTTGHCGVDCQLAYGTCSTVTTTSQAPKPTDISTDGACGANGKKCQGSGFGECCSATNYCGSTINHCAQGCQKSFSSTCLTSNVPTLDGSCGSAKGGFTCAGGPFDGNCCSSGGFCGSTTAHCASGCQKTFGRCT